MAQALKGGEVGANGEFYKGGQFINTIKENQKKEGSTPKKARKVEVESYKWEAAREGLFPIFSIIGTQAAYVDRYNVAKGIAPWDAGVAHYGSELHGHKIADLCEAYNNGERWATR